MGSRAVVIVCRDEDAARRRFGVVEEGIGICYTRTGRRFFDNPKIEKEFLEKVRTTLDATDFWNQFQTDWICLDAELMPWSAKAQELLRQQYASVGAAAQASLTEAVAALDRLESQNAEAHGSRRALQAAARSCESLCGFLPSLLLAGKLHQRPEACTVSPTGNRKPSSRQSRSRLAHGKTGRGL